MSRRRFIATLLTGVSISILGLSGGRKSTRRDVLRPPGAVAEEAFLALCARCGRCIPVCPNSAIRLHGLENGVENLFTPKLVPARGYCITPVNGCQNCIEACPTRVLQPFDVEGTPSDQLARVLKMGTAFVDVSICLPYAQKKPCLACFEVCPVDGAITVERGKDLGRPVFNHELCVGCGACENVCPTTTKAVTVSSSGAKRIEWRG